MRYKVTWEIDVDSLDLFGDGPVEAAKEAWRVMRMPDSIANVFVVVDEQGTRTLVDLGEAPGIDPLSFKAVFDLGW